MISFAATRRHVTRFQNSAILNPLVLYSLHMVQRGIRMTRLQRDGDKYLVAACLLGDQHAWTEFYCRFLKVVRNTVRRQRLFAYQDVEDVTQLVFLSLIPGLKSYDDSYSLARFVAIVAERVSVGEYRKRTALKRDAVLEPVEHHDNTSQARVLPSVTNNPEREFLVAEEVDALRVAFRQLREQCRELLRLRYHEDRSYKELTEVFNASENALTVRVRRCLDELRDRYGETSGKGKSL